MDQFLIQMGWANEADELLGISVRPGGEASFPQLRIILQ